MVLTTRTFAGLVLIASAIVLGAALLSQYWGGLAPCELCLLQRWPWVAAIVISSAAMIVADRTALPWVALALAGVFAVGSALAFYHVGVERHWFAGPTPCTGTATAAGTIEAWKAHTPGQMPVPCAEPAGPRGGTSLAGWTLLARLGRGGGCLAIFP